MGLASSLSYLNSCNQRERSGRG